MNSNNFLAGLGGALVLTILNESLKNINHNMPRINLVGEEAVYKAAQFLGYEIEDEHILTGSTLVGDIVSNATYYSLISGEGKELWAKAVSSGLLAGYGVVNLPDKIELDDTPVAKNLTTKALTIGYYLAGALATATILQFLEKRNL
ncbi:hypothetical protein [Flavobacterium sp.]|uniref:hypothetical protein n=1 Tax=Flavobacterium sp. TaxID=239 RepID=UPI003C5DF541